MAKVGFIGYGSMGSMLVNGFISSNTLPARDIIVSTYTKEKLKKIKDKWRDINIACSNIDVVKNAKYIFVCVKPLQVRDVLAEIREFLRKDQILISIAGCVTIPNIEKLIDGKIVKIIPTLVSEVNEGITLICYNSKISGEEKSFIEKLFNSISRVKIINEDYFEVAADLTSCAPGLIAAIFQEFVEAGLRHSTFSKEEVEEMVLLTLYGTAKLLYENNMKFDETISRVATKGGITEEGVKVLKEGLPHVFDRVFEKTLTKHGVVKEIICKDFNK